MTQASTVYKISQPRHGVVAGLSEYTSRRCRLMLVRMTARAVERELQRNHVRGLSGLDPRVGAAGVLARLLGVATRTVQRWLSGGVQSCNVNADKLIQLALRYDPFEAEEILREDLENHRFYLEYMVQGRQGVVGV